MSLPVMTTVDDVKAIVGYLKNKPTGATMDEARPVVGKLLDGRKAAAYSQWGFVGREGDRLKLLELGWELARKPSEEKRILRMAIGGIPAYRSALEWIHHNSHTSVTNVDVAAYWHDHHSSALGTSNENTIKDNAVCFFHLCSGAGLGKLTMGRHGQATRLDIDLGELRSFVEAGPTTPPWTTAEPEILVEDTNEGGSEFLSADNPPAPERNQVAPAEALRVFIAHSANMDIVDQIKTMLDLADIDSEVAEEEETSAIPVPEKVLNAMRRCGAGIIAVTADEAHRDESGNFTINENVLIEIGAAFVLYDRRVVLLWDKRLSIPSNLQGLYRCEFEGDELSWSAGMKLMKAIQGFKK